jgi:hypothetical protein
MDTIGDGLAREYSMKTFVSILASAVLLAPAVADAETVYRCVQNGKTIFTDDPVDSSCGSIDLQVHHPSPEDLARLHEEKRLQAEEERMEREEAQREELIRAQVDAARAAQRSAEAQRRLAEEQARRARQQTYPSPYPMVWPGYGYTLPGPYLRPPVIAPQPPILVPRHSTPNYPYAPDQISVGNPGKR